MNVNEIAEIQVQERINKNIDLFKSFRFNAGAGAGKTYALIETLKYVSANKIATTKNEQKVACITYTNVAVNEIKNRLGKSDVVSVSTIHERLWEIIKRSQPELLLCHKEKILEAIEKNRNNLIQSEKSQFFVSLSTSEQQEFIEFTLVTKNLYYKSKKLDAASFKSAYQINTEFKKPEFINKCMKNLDKFKYVVDLILNGQKLKKCLERIDAKEECRVNYDSKVNKDRLHYMKFSHDTLIEYSLKLVESYPTLCRIIIDSYPYFFIDEYQDTHSNVIKFIKIIHDYSVKNEKKWMVGYFGDTAQSIYDDGVGRSIANIHKELVNIDKKFNRRSHQQIIDVANKIRADEIVQSPIFEDRNSGTVRFYYNATEQKMKTAQKFLTDFRNYVTKNISEKETINDDKNKIHCLVLTNKLMAEFNGFGDVYEVYQNSAIYYDNLNSQVLSQQLEKLHPTVLIIYKFVRLYQDIHSGEVSYYDIFGSSSKSMAFSDASLVIRELESKICLTLKDWFYLIFDRLENSDAKESLGKALINRINYDKEKLSSADTFRDTFFESINLLMTDYSEVEDESKSKFESVLALPIASLINWSNFISGINSGDIIYHTYHGTKGEEYHNVAIVMEHSFGSKNRDKFKNYFNIIQKSDEEAARALSISDSKEKHINTKNLLYVACSRAVKNLRILYLDDISEIKAGIEIIFGESEIWPT